MFRAHLEGAACLLSAQDLVTTAAEAVQSCGNKNEALLLLLLPPLLVLLLLVALLLLLPLLLSALPLLPLSLTNSKHS